MKPLNKEIIIGCQNQKIQLRTKIGLILNRVHLNSCHNFVDKINSFNRKVIDYSSTASYVNTQIQKSKKFRFDSSSKPWTVHYMSTELFSPDYNKIRSLLNKYLTKEEIHLISTDVDFYIKDKELKDNLNIFDQKPLTETIIREEEFQKEIDQKKRGDSITHSLKQQDDYIKRIAIKKNTIYNIVNECSSSYSHSKFNDYLQKLIQQDKERVLLKEKKEREKATVVDKLIKSSQVELDNCNKILNNRKTLINSLKNQIEGYGDNVMNEDGKQNFNYVTKTQKTIPSDDQNNNNNNTTSPTNKNKKGKKNEFKKMILYIKEGKKNDKHSFKNNYQQENESENFVKQYIRTIKDIFTNPHSNTKVIDPNCSLTLPLINRSYNRSSQYI